MKNTIINQTCASVVLFFSLSAMSLAFSDGNTNANHFPSVASPTVTAAKCNLAKYNAILTKLINQPELSITDMLSVHELTYTLEQTIERLQVSLEDVAEEVEKVHKASEHLDPNVIASSGQLYQEKLQAILQKTTCPIETASTN
jgi:hypothetical protein